MKAIFYSSRPVFIVFHGFRSVFSRFKAGFSWFYVGFYSFSRFQVAFHVFYGSRSGFQDSRWIFIVINGSRLDFHDYRWIVMAIYGSRLVFLVCIVPGWFKSGARGAKWDVGNTPKDTDLICILAPDPARPCWLWPNDDDDVEEEEDVSLFLCTITYNVES